MDSPRKELARKAEEQAREAKRRFYEHLAEQSIAFEGVISFEKWQDTSARGFKITFGLASRNDLNYFDGVMSIRGRRGGQRYNAIVQPYWRPDGPGTPAEADHAAQFVEEWHFAGRGWSESAGAHLAIVIHDPAAIAGWRMRKTVDQLTDADEADLCQCYVMLQEIDDDELIVNQARRKVVQQVEKGGARSKKVARMCQDHEFQLWLNRHSIYADPEDPELYTDPAAADHLIKRVCGIESKRFFDVGPHADTRWRMFDNQFNRPFVQWLARDGR